MGGTLQNSGQRGGVEILEALGMLLKTGDAVFHMTEE